MKLSTRARYALSFMLQLARGAGTGSNLSIAEAAKATNISRRYLEQLAMGLKQATLITATTGREGGYRLARPPAKIRLREVVEASIGPVSIVDCIGEPDLCMWTEKCECRMLYALINKRITETLDDFSLADMAGAGWAEKVASASGDEGAPPARDGGATNDQGVPGCPV